MKGTLADRGKSTRDDEGARRIRQLRDEGCTWSTVKSRMDRETGTFREIETYMSWLARFKKRQRVA